MPPIEFNAPWSRSLRTTTGVGVTIIVLVAVVFSRLAIDAALRNTLTALPIAILFIAALYTVRGYSLTETELIIKRWIWPVRLPLFELQSVGGDAEAMNGSLRIFGNAGFFSYTGLFWNRRLKFYRVYATDPSRAVILRWPRRTIVITPHDPQQFIVRARTVLKTKSF